MLVTAAGASDDCRSSSGGDDGRATVGQPALHQGSIGLSHESLCKSHAPSATVATVVMASAAAVTPRQSGRKLAPAMRTPQSTPMREDGTSMNPARRSDKVTAPRRARACAHLKAQ